MLNVWVHALLKMYAVKAEDMMCKCVSVRCYNKQLVA